MYKRGLSILVTSLILILLVLVAIGIIWTVVNTFSIKHTNNKEHVYYIDATLGNNDNDGLSELNAWKTISKINEQTFNPGDSILFKRGEIWCETLIIPSSGNSTSSIYFGAYDSGVLPKINISSPNYGITINGHDYLTFENIEISGGKKSIFLNSASTNGSIIFRNIKIHNSIGDCISAKNRGNFLIDNSEIYSCGHNGISSYTTNINDYLEIKGHNIEIKNSLIYNNIANGIYIAGHNSHIINNSIYENGNSLGYHNLYLIGDNGLVEKNNLLNSSMGDGFRYEGGNLTFRYNFVKGNRMHGVSFWNDIPQTFYNNRIYYNVISATKYHDSPYENPGAIYINEYAGGFNIVDIFNNVIHGSNAGVSGILLRDCNNVNLKNNVFKMISNTIEVHVKCEEGFESDYNLFFSETEDCFDLESAGGYGNFSEWQDYAGQDINSLYTKPIFVNEFLGTADGFKLQSNSPAINLGVDVGLIRDFRGSSISGQPDAGAYEYY